MKNKDIKFLVDVGVGKKVETSLREMGYDVKGEPLAKVLK